MIEPSLVAQLEELSDAVLETEWERWARDTSEAEAETAAILEGVVEGDRLDFVPIPTPAVTVREVRDRPAHRRILVDVEDSQARIAFYVVRGKYVFAIDRQTGYPLAVDWSDEPEAFIEVVE